MVCHYITIALGWFLDVLVCTWSMLPFWDYISHYLACFLYCFDFWHGSWEKDWGEAVMAILAWCRSNMWMVVIAKSLLCSFGVGVPAHPCMFTSVVLCSLLRWYVLKCDYYALCVALHICLNFKHPFQLLFLIKTWRMALCLHKEYLQIMIQLIQLCL